MFICLILHPHIINTVLTLIIFILINFGKICWSLDILFDNPYALQFYFWS